MVIGILILLGLLLLFSLWAMCRAAGEVNTTTEWNENWIGQKFDEERKDETD